MSREDGQARGRGWLRSRRVVTLLAVAAMAVGVAVPVSASGASSHGPDSFVRWDPGAPSPSGHSVIEDCQDSTGGDGWLDATATLRLREKHGTTRAVVRIRNAAPDTYYTIWLRLGGTDSNGNAFGGNPVTGGKATPLAATSDLPALLAATGSGNGNDEVANGFYTNARGTATFRTTLDFPIHAGAYPFQRFPDWDPTDERLPAEDPAIYPVAVAGPQGPFTLRIVSHCTDGVGHGLGSGPREIWFDWTVSS